MLELGQLDLIVRLPCDYCPTPFSPEPLGPTVRSTFRRRYGRSGGMTDYWDVLDMRFWGSISPSSPHPSPDGYTLALWDGLLGLSLLCCRRRCRHLYDFLSLLVSNRTDTVSPYRVWCDRGDVLGKVRVMSCLFFDGSWFCRWSILLVDERAGGRGTV